MFLPLFSLSLSLSLSLPFWLFFPFPIKSSLFKAYKIMARTVFLQKSWTDLPIEWGSPLLCPSLSNSKNLCYAFLLFNPFNTRCPNNNQPKVSLFYFFLFFDFLFFLLDFLWFVSESSFSRCTFWMLNIWEVLQTPGAFPVVWVADAVIIDFDSEKNGSYLPGTVLFLCISLFHMLYKHHHDTLWRHKDNILLWPNLWQGDVYSGGRCWLILNWVS